MAGGDNVVVLTGATSGIGRVAAETLAGDGWTVAAVGRDRDRGQSLPATGLERSGQIDFHRADLSVQSTVRELASTLLDRYPSIDALVHNAGLYVRERTVTPDGIEQTFAVNVLAPYLLTHELADRLVASAPARLVITASTVHRRGTLDFEDLQFASGYDAMDAYAASKLAAVAFTLEAADRFPDDVSALSLHPGFIPGTRFFRDGSLWTRAITRAAGALPFIGSSTADGGERLCRLVQERRFGEATGLYLDGDAVADPAAPARDPGTRERLWRASADLVGVDPDWP